jgi:hypothetical protein
MNAKKQPMASILEELEKHCFKHEIMTILEELKKHHFKHVKS